MVWLITGVVLWFFVHGFKALFPATRQRLADKMGTEQSKGPVAIGILLSLALIVYGWRHSSPAEFLYFAPGWGRHVTSLLMLIAIYLLTSSTAPLRYRKWIRHPQLLATTLWSIGHLLANGELRSVILFAGIGIWSVAVMLGINKRDGAYEPPTPGSLMTEAKYLIIAFIACLVIIAAHGYFTAIPLISW